MTLSTCYTFWIFFFTVIFPGDKTTAANLRKEVNLIRTVFLGKASVNFQKVFTGEAMYLLYPCAVTNWKLPSSTHFSWIVNSTSREMIRRDWSWFKCLNLCMSATRLLAVDRPASRAARTHHHKYTENTNHGLQPFRLDRSSKTQQN